MEGEIEIEIVPPPQPHNGKNITKIAISPQSKYVVTYSQEDKSFVGWSVDNDLTYDTYASSPYSKFNELGLDFKVSDEKIIILNKGKFV